jgi:hypothetical protein
VAGMESFTLTRYETASLLLSLQGSIDKTPLNILQEAWRRTHPTALPTVFDKLLKSQRPDGLSLTEIVSLGNRIEYTHVSVTSVQNWVKRDFKTFLGSPQCGKKYSFEQAALLFIIEDLKMTLDFDSIRNLFQILFRTPEDDHDDLLRPTELLFAYSSLFEEMDANDDQLLDIGGGHEHSLRNRDLVMENAIVQRTSQYVEKLDHLTEEEREAVRNTLIIALVSVQAAYFHSLSRRYMNATLFLHGK